MLPDNDTLQQYLDSAALEITYTGSRLRASVVDFIKNLSPASGFQLPASKLALQVVLRHAAGLEDSKALADLIAAMSKNRYQVVIMLQCIALFDVPKSEFAPAIYKEICCIQQSAHILLASLEASFKNDYELSEFYFLKAFVRTKNDDGNNFLRRCDYEFSGRCAKDFLICNPNDKKSIEMLYRVLFSDKCSNPKKMKHYYTSLHNKIFAGDVSVQDYLTMARLSVYGFGSMDPKIICTYFMNYFKSGEPGVAVKDIEVFVSLWPSAISRSLYLNALAFADQHIKAFQFIKMAVKNTFPSEELAEMYARLASFYLNGVRSDGSINKSQSSDDSVEWFQQPDVVEAIFCLWTASRLSNNAFGIEELARLSNEYSAAKFALKLLSNKDENVHISFSKKALELRHSAKFLLKVAETEISVREKPSTRVSCLSAVASALEKLLELSKPKAKKQASIVGRFSKWKNRKASSDSVKASQANFNDKMLLSALKARLRAIDPKGDTSKPASISP